MSVALRGCEDFTAVYLDDILIFSPDWETHVQHLSRVFSALEKDSYHIRLYKCVFFQEQVPFLGHILTQDGIMASENRHEALNAFQPPFCSRRQIKSFLGIVMWYRSFIPHVATLAAPSFRLDVDEEDAAMDGCGNDFGEDANSGIAGAAAVETFSRREGNPRDHRRVYRGNWSGSWSRSGERNGVRLLSGAGN